MPSTNVRHVEPLSLGRPTGADARPNSAPDLIPADVVPAAIPPADNPSPIFARLRRAVLPLIAAAVVMAALVLFAKLPFLAGGLAFVALAAAFLVLNPAPPPLDARAPSAGWAIE